MNRMPHLSQTLPVNIAENQDCPDLEFVVLNYNSRDDMDQWMRTHMSDHIASGLVKYYRTTEPEFFNLAHSKNMCTNLATGEVVCNVDADNFAGPGYINWVRECFAVKGPDTVITTLRKDGIPYRDQGGKLCFTKALFNAVNGYDESIFGYGMDDVDFCNRLENAGATRVFIEEEKYLRFIPHSDEERIANYRYPNNLISIYQCMTDDMEDIQKVLYLFTDHTAAEMTYRFNESVSSNLVITFLGWTVDRGGHRKAAFSRTKDGLKLTFMDGAIAAYHVEDQLLTPVTNGVVSAWKEIRKEDENYMLALMGYNECLNRLKYVENDRPVATINRNGWGRGAVNQVSF